MVAQKSGDRSAYFGAIEKKHGQPMRYWHGVMAELVDEKYAEQIAFLKENHGFSQAHANALVMYSRGSKTSKRFNNLTDYLAPHDACNFQSDYRCESKDEISNRMESANVEAG